MSETTKAAKSTEFVAGDVVQLKGGSCSMTIAYMTVERYSTGKAQLDAAEQMIMSRIAVCEWHDVNGHPQKKLYLPAMLKKAAPK